MRHLLAFFCVMAVIGKGFSLRCYECESSRDHKCADPIDSRSFTPIDCSLRNNGPSFCEKSLHREHDREVVVRRGCTILSPQDVHTQQRSDACTYDSVSGFSRCLCSTELCNGADGAKAAVATFVAIAVAIAFVNL